MTPAGASTSQNNFDDNIFTREHESMTTCFGGEGSPKRAYASIPPHRTDNIDAVEDVGRMRDRE